MNERNGNVESERLVRLREVGHRLGDVSSKTVRRMIAAGQLPAPVYVGRTPMLCESEIDAAIERFKQQRKAKS